MMKTHWNRKTRDRDGDVPARYIVTKVERVENKKLPAAYTERKNVIQLFRNPGEHDDFMKRPWWDWVHGVFYKVFAAMVDLGLDKAPERFLRYMKLTCGGFGGFEVYTDVCWDFNESLENMNKMFKRVGTDFQIILRAMHKGLRVRGRESPVMIP